MAITMREFKDIIEFTIKNKLQHAILGLGAPGIGKSAIIAQLAKQYGYAFKDIRLAQMSEVEIGGLIYPGDPDQNGNPTTTHWLKPDFLPTENDPPTIILLDEITSCSKKVQVAAYQLVLDRRIGVHKLPEDAIIIALGNREDDDGVFFKLAAPLADRFTIGEITLVPEEWLHDYALNKNVSCNVINGKNTYFNPVVSAFIMAKPTYLHTQEANPDAMIFATPRSWTKISDYLNAAGFNGGNLSPLLQNLIRATVDETTATEFIAFAGSSEEIRIGRDIIDGKTVSIPHDKDANLFIISSIVSNLNNLIDKNTKLADVEEIYSNVLHYVSKLEGELTSMALDSIRDLNSKLMTEYVRKYPGSINAIAGAFAFLNTLAELPDDPEEAAEALANYEENDKDNEELDPINSFNVDFDKESDDKDYSLDFGVMDAFGKSNDKESNVIVVGDGDVDYNELLASGKELMF